MIRFRLAWWGSVLLAIVAYGGLKYGVTSLLPPTHKLQGLLELLAPLVAMAFLLLAAKQLYDDTEPPNDEPPNSSATNGKRE